MLIKKILKIVILFGIASSMLTLSGCATMFGDNTRTVHVTSDPSGAAVYVNGVQYGVTPANVTLPSYIYGGIPIQFKKAGYQDSGYMVNPVFQPVGLLNIFNLGIGFLVDAATGDVVAIDPDNRYVRLKLQPNH